MAVQELLRGAKETMEQRVGLFGYTTEDHVAWLYGTMFGAFLKAGKYHNGDLYRKITAQMAPIYRAVATKDKLSGLQAYQKWYEMGPAVLQKVREALATVAQVTTTR